MSFSINDSARIRWRTSESQLLADTGATEDHNGTALTVGRMATLTVGAAAIRITMAATTGLSNQVGATAEIVPAYGRLDWFVESDTCVVYAQAADGAAAYEAWVKNT
jgi:hypothetical protein